MKVIGYIRVSTAKQADKGASLEAQEAKLRAYCQLYEHELIGIFSDPGASAKNLKREGVQAALNALEDGEAGALLVVKLDRLTRSTRDLSDLIERYFSEGENALLSVGEHLDTTSASGRLVMNILMSVFQWEREATGERTRAVKAHQKSQGRFLGGSLPYGFGRDSQGQLIHNMAEQNTIKLIERLHAADLSYDKIATALNTDNRLTRSGRPWLPGTVWNVIKKQEANGRIGE